MFTRMFTVGIAIVFMSASQPAVSAQSDTGAIKGRGIRSTPTQTLQTQGRSKVKNIRGKRNPSDQGRDR